MGFRCGCQRSVQGSVVASERAVLSTRVQHIHSLLEDDVYGNAGIGKSIEILLKDRADPSITIDEVDGTLVITIPLQHENLLGQSRNGVERCLQVYSIRACGFITRKGARFPR